MSGLPRAHEAVRYVGEPDKRQVDSAWLQPGDLIFDPSLVAVFRDLPDFEVVHTTLPVEEPELDAEEEV